MEIWHLYLMAFFYAFAGVQHFRNPRFFLKITPPWVPRPDLVNWVVGAVEILLSIGLLPESSRSIAAWGVIVLLVLVFPANFFHFQKAKKKKKMVLPTLMRLPVQLLLIWWAYSYV